MSSKVKADNNKQSPKDSAKAENSENESIGDDSASVSTSTTSRSKSPGSRGGRRQSRAPSKSKVNRPSYKYDCHLKEDHGQAIFGVAFNHLLGKDQTNFFATAGSNRCSVYECPRKGGLN